MPDISSATTAHGQDATAMRSAKDERTSEEEEEEEESADEALLLLLLLTPTRRDGSAIKITPRHSEAESDTEGSGVTDVGDVAVDVALPVELLIGLLPPDKY